MHVCRDSEMLTTENISHHKHLHDLNFDTRHIKV